MPKISEGVIAITSLVLLAVWLLIGLPLFYLPNEATGFLGWLTKDAAGFFTFVLMIVGGAQLALFWHQLRLIRASLDDAKIAALAAKDSANAAIRQARTAEESFANLERPYIYVFGIKGLECDFDQMEPYDFLKYSVANYGKTPASLESSCLRISIGTSPEVPVTVRPWHSLIALPILTPNERRENLTEPIPDNIETTQYADEDTPPGPFTVPVLEEGKEFFFWIQIKYHGPFSVGHETSACWRWDSTSDRLILYGGEQYNYTR